MNMEELEAEINTEIKNKMEENMVTATKESKVNEKAGEKWAAFNKTERMAVILDSHTFPGVLKKDWKDINPKLQTRLAGSFAAAKNAKETPVAPVAPIEAPVEANKEPEETLSDDIKDITVTVIEEPIKSMTDEEAMALAEQKLAEASARATAHAAAHKSQMVTPVEKPKRTRKVKAAV